MQTYLDIVHLTTYVAACAARSGVKVVWDDPDSVPRTDSKTIWLPRITSKTSPERMLEIRYYIKHECSHIVYTNFLFYKENKIKGLLHFVCNLLEDNRIDYLNDSEYLGDISLSNSFAEVYAERLCKMATEPGTISEQMLMLTPLFMWDADNRDWITSYSLIKGHMAPFLDGVGMLRLEKLSAGDYAHKLVSLRTSPNGGDIDLLELAISILTNIFDVKNPDDYIEAQDDKKASKGMKSDEEGEDEEGEGEGEGSGEGDTDEEGDGEPSRDEVDRLITVDETAAKLSADHLTSSRTGIHLKHTVTRGGWVIPATNDYLVLRFPLKNAPEGDDRPCFSQHNVHAMIENVAKPLSNQLRHHLQVKAKGRYEYGTRMGKLHNGSLHRLVSGRGTQAESRVFRKHVTTDTLDTAVSLLVDCSGSMSGSKFEMACAAAASLALALKPLHIAYNVLGFTNNTEHNDDPMMWVFSDWNENVTQENLVGRFREAAGRLWENSDGDAIAWANHYLLTRKETRKMLIVLSDGAPSGRAWAGSATGYTAAVINSIEDSKRSEIYGIGIQDKNVEQYYKNHAVTHKADDLTGAILSIIKRI